MNDIFDTSDGRSGPMDCNTDCRKNCPLALLNRMSRKLARAVPVEEVYQIIGDSLHELIPDSIVILSSFDHASGQFHVRAVTGVDSDEYLSIRVHGKSIFKIPFDINGEAKMGLSRGILEKLPGGLCELAMGSLSKRTCDILQKRLGLGDVYAIGLNLDCQLFGSVNILLRCDAGYMNKAMTTTLVSLASVALQKWYAEDALRGHRDNLESLVQLKTAELESANKDLEKELAERQRAEEEARHTAEQLQNLMETAPVIIARADLNLKITYVNKKFEEATGYSREEVIGRSWYPSEAISGKQGKAMLKRMKDRLAGKPPTGMEAEAKCKNGQIKHFAGFSQIIKENGAPVAIQILALDITEQKLAEDNAKKSAKRMLKALEDMIGAMVITMELRDPYTAGHQKRVTHLAYAIACDIGLSQDRALGVRLAALVHDIGKIRVPAEILTNTGILNDAEMSIIRMHPAVGYEILKNVEFPWPIAQAVLQHHERLNGSGYPSGLKNKQIIKEAKILAVADVVEAMASHRPYRPALGLNAALGEIESNSGKLYDAAVVDSALNVFRNKGFKFEELSTAGANRMD